MEKITKKTSILYNQLWIDKAILEGHMDFLPVHKFPNKSIGEHIEIKYNQLENDEHDRLYHEAIELQDFSYINRVYEETPKITKHNSILFEREWLIKYKEEGLSTPNLKSQKYSRGEILEILYYKKALLERPNPEKLYGNIHRKKKKRLFKRK